MPNMIDNKLVIMTRTATIKGSIIYDSDVARKRRIKTCPFGERSYLALNAMFMPLANVAKKKMREEESDVLNGSSVTPEFIAELMSEYKKEARIIVNILKPMVNISRLLYVFLLP